MKKGNFFRKYVIDMINCYQVEKLMLLFEKSSSTVKMRVKVGCPDGKCLQEFYYPDHVWKQVAGASFGQSMEKLFRNPIKSGLNALAIPI